MNIIDRTKIKSFVAATVVGGVCLLASQGAAALIITVGEQDFTDGTTIALVATYDAAQANESSLELFNGGDLGSAGFSKTWSFSYAAGAYTSASLSFGMYDIDCLSSSCSPLSIFTLDGTSFANALTSQVQSTATYQNLAYDIFTLDISSILGSLSDGLLNVSLSLNAPNGAGLDFARLDLQTTAVPEPGTVTLLGLGLAGLGAIRRKRS